MSAENRPHSPEAERVVLAAMISGHASEAISKGVDETWFLGSQNQEVFAGIKKLFDTGSELNELTVATAFNTIESMNMPVSQDESDIFIAQLPYGDVPNWMAALNICETKRNQRMIIRHARELLEAAQEPQGYMEGLSSAIEAPMGKITTFSLNGQEGNAIDEFEEFIQEQMDEAKGITERVPMEHRLHTGMPQLEDLIGHVDSRRRDNNIVIGAPSSTGKSALMRQMMVKNLEAHKDWVIAGFLLESSKEDWWKAAARSHAGIDTRMPLTKIDGAKLKRYFAYLQWLKDQTDVRLFLFDCPASVNLINAKCREIKAKTGRIDLICTDYIQILERERRGSTEAEVAENSRSLQQLQKRFACPHITGSQLNEDGKVRESRAIYNDATIVWIIDRPERDNRNNKQEDGQSVYFQTLRQDKCRGGPKTTVGFEFEVTTQTMRDI